MHTDDPHRINFKKPDACGRRAPGLKMVTMYSEQDLVSVNAILSHNLVSLVLEIFLKNKLLVIISLIWPDLFYTGIILYSSYKSTHVYTANSK